MEDISLRGLGGLVAGAAVKWRTDNAPRLGAALAFFTTLAIPPLLVIILLLLRLWYDADTAGKQIFAQISLLIGDEGGRAVQEVFSTQPQAHRQAAGVLAAGVLVVTVIGVFVELQAVINFVWNIRPKREAGWWHFVRSRLLSFTMVLGLGFLLVVSLVASTVLAALGKYVGGFAPEQHLLWSCVNAVISFAVFSVFFALIFKFLPDAKIAWRDVWVGGVTTALLFVVGKSLLGIYLGHSEAITAWGAAGSVVLVLLWVYYSAQIFIFGAEITKLFADHFGSQVRPTRFSERVDTPPEIAAPARTKAEIGEIAPS